MNLIDFFELQLLKQLEKDPVMLSIKIYNGSNRFHELATWIIAHWNLWFN